MCLDVDLVTHYAWYLVGSLEPWSFSCGNFSYISSKIFSPLPYSLFSSIIPII